MLYYSARGRGRNLRGRQVGWLPGGFGLKHHPNDCQSAFKFGSDAVLVQLTLFCAD